jgi:hypothetical protein
MARQWLILEVREVGLPELVRAGRLLVELVARAVPLNRWRARPSPLMIAKAGLVTRSWALRSL